MARTVKKIKKNGTILFFRSCVTKGFIIEEATHVAVHTPATVPRGAAYFAKEEVCLNAFFKSSSITTPEIEPARALPFTRGRMLL